MAAKEVRFNGDARDRPPGPRSAPPGSSVSDQHGPQPTLRPTIPLPVTLTSGTYATLPVVAVVVGILASLFGMRRAVRTDPALAFSGA